MTNQELGIYFNKIIESGKIPHAIIVDGVKTDDEKKPVFEFVSKLMGSINHQDVIRVTHEKQHLISIEEVRRQIVDNIIIKPYAKPYKIYIIDDAELMNIPAQNTLLKTLEEPPSYAIVFLLTGNASSLLDTIISRCVYLSVAELITAQPLLPEEEKYFREKGALIPYLSGVDAYALVKELIKNDKDKTSTFLNFFNVIEKLYADALLCREGIKSDADACVRKLASQDEKNIIKQINAIEKAKERCKLSVNNEMNLRELFISMKG